MLTAEENVALPLAIAGVQAAEAQRRAIRLLEEVGLAEHAAIGRMNCRAANSSTSPSPVPW